ncbi:Brp/Blh family beta-carotene 15,15'-dioxygenase [Pelagibacterales bacterium SAG-MED20]|nr:Brp/Blh family beta-carotene 15,15'-dioxygenase [Pelagibacterales bacterium SAG-MED20]
MKNYIQKLNLRHSLIFFLLANFFSIIIDQNKNLIISPLICLLLILTIGISHGSLDNIKGKKLLNILGISNIYFFYSIYILISFLVIIIWFFFPILTLVSFLVVASYHFGKEDTNFLVIDNSLTNQIFYFLKGLLIVIAPLNFHFEETLNIFKVLFVESEKFYLYLGYLENFKIIQIIFLLSVFSNFYLFAKNFKFFNFSIFLDFFSILILNYYLSPLLAFTFYFCFLHSIRHSFSLIIELDNSNFKNGLFMFLKKAIPLTSLTIIIYLITLFYLSNFFEFNDATLKVIFIGLASLTFPHILLEYFLEKNEK